MIDELCQLWWMFTIKGLASIAFALICYFFSSFTALHLLQPMGYLYLLVIFTFYIGLVGIILLVGSIYSFDARLRHRWLLLADALSNLAIGPVFLITFGFGLSFSKVVVLFGLHAGIAGAGYLIFAIYEGKREYRLPVLGSAGLWSLAAGAVLVLRRHAPEGKLTVAVAIYSGVLGVILLLLSLSLRAAAHRRLPAALSPAL
ncbi:MAG TPA: hypothetical protein VGR96_07895 [Acidobacteriaceae bacterium]|nr:hypothetical protein [Acidobacteriaceae bacterium]